MRVIVICDLRWIDSGQKLEEFVRNAIAQPLPAGIPMQLPIHVYLCLGRSGITCPRAETNTGQCFYNAIYKIALNLHVSFPRY